MIKLSVIIISLNEERNIERCLSSVKALADEIVILDSFSTDKTKEIAEGYGAKVIQKEFEGYVGARRTVESLATYDYVLAIDADEALSDELQNSILELKKNWTKDGYCVARKTNYCGQWINHSGWYPDRKMRLYKRGSGHWEGKYVHEKYTLSPGSSREKLKGDLLHYSYYNESDHWERTAKYSDLSALELFEDGRKSSIFHAYFRALTKFFRIYFINFGFLDGRKGYIICKITAWGTYQKYASLLKMKKAKNGNRVLHLSSAISWRGGEQQLSYLHQTLQSADFEQFVLSPYNSVLYKRLLNAKKSNLIGYKKNPFTTLFLAFIIARLCKRKNIGLIHVHDSHAHSYAFISAWIFGNKTPLVVHRRVDFPVGKSWLSKLKYNHKSVRTIICVSEAIKKIMSKDIINEGVLKVVYSGIDLNRFLYKNKTKKLNQLLKLSEDVIIIGNTSALAPHKDYFTFVDTAEIILKSIPRAHFVIIGNGPLENEVKDYFKQKELLDRVSFTGFRNDIHELLPDFDVFLMTSTTEGLGTSIIDAFACNVPVVSTKAGGIPELIEHEKSGLLAPIGNAEQLAHNVVRLLNDELLRQNIIAGAAEKLNSFTKDQMAKGIVAVYKDIKEMSI